MAATNILSLDGGGTWALLQTRALADLYPGETGHEILSRFDFAFANSGGSIVLGGLMANMTPEAIEAYFTDAKHREAMYRPTSHPLDRVLAQFHTGPQYSTGAKRTKLDAVFGNRPFVSRKPLDGRETHFVIVAFDYVRSRAFLFRSAGSPRFPTVTGLSIAEAVHASSTAPVLYYDEPATLTVSLDYPGVAELAPRPMQFWDGGVTGMNNPVAAAVSEAIAVGHRPDQIAVLSIGTATGVQSNNPAHGGDPRQLAAEHENGWLVPDISKLAKSVVGDPPDFASFFAHTMTGGRAPTDDATVDATRVVRISPLVLGDFVDGDWVRPAWNHAALGYDLFERLQDLGMDATGDGDVADIQRLADAWLADRAWNQPIRLNFFQGENGLHAEIGHDRYSKAKAAAIALGLV